MLTLTQAAVSAYLSGETNSLQDGMCLDIPGFLCCLDSVTSLLVKKFSRSHKKAALELLNRCFERCPINRYLILTKSRGNPCAP